MIITIFLRAAALFYMALSGLTCQQGEYFETVFFMVGAIAVAVLS